MTRTGWIAVALLTASSAARAAEFRHRVGADEPMETVAKNYYGASWKAVYITARNDLDTTTGMVGKRVVIPASWKYRIRRGDSLAAIAKRFLGDARRHKAIMSFNNIRDPADLSVGQELLMPFHLFHDTRPGETLSSIARRYYRTARRATLLKEYNSVDDLKAGQRLTIPIFDTATLDVKSRRYTAAAPAKETQLAAAAPAVSAQARAGARAELARAKGGFRAGKFDEACIALDSLLEANLLGDKDEAELFKYLGFCAVAFDDEKAARDYFGQWLDRDPKAQLDSKGTSPKIRRVFDKASEIRRQNQTEGNQPGPQDGP
jgi:LysM repeat protein